ncbi:MAG: 16S rRNA (guanine(527)-N(7))-methyltransferase RsmG [Pseudomonadota bacterium]
MNDRDDDRFGLEMASERSGVMLASDVQECLLTYADLLRRWQAAQNLVGPDTIKDLWTRHVADSLQLVPLIRQVLPDQGVEPRGITVVDLGSGAGLPGMVLAMVLSEDQAPSPNVGMHLIDSNQRKAAFLRAVSRETNTPVAVHGQRIDAVKADDIPANIVTARALAPLTKLIALANPWLTRGATAFFHKGGDTESEITAWSDAADYSVVQHVSVIDPNSRILQIRRLDAPS